MRRCAAFCAAVALLGAGCGGEDAGPGQETTGDRLTKSEFIARGDAICAEAQADLGRIEQRVDAARRMPRARQMTEIAAIWRQQLEIAERYKARFEALRPPAADTARFREFLRALEDGIRLSRKIVAHLDDRREPPRELFVAYGRVVYRGNTLAQGYGFEVCGRSSG